MKTLRIILALIILLLLFVFSINNAQSVQIIFLSYQTPPMPLFLVLLFIFFLGVILAALFGAMKISQLHRRLNRLRREIEILKKDDSRRQDETLSQHG
jgi:uncharacterized integral membrane protein